MKIAPRRISLSSSPFYASLCVIIGLGVFMAIFWAFNEFEAYNESIENIRQSYETRYQKRVKEELGKAIDFIDYRKSQAQQRLENGIRDKAQSAYSIASHMYSRHKDEMSEEDLRDLVVEVLRPIRWNSGRGYYFAGRVDEHVIDLYADDPYYEGQHDLGPMSEHVSVFENMIEEKGAGIYRYNWTKPDNIEIGHPIISFIKYFRPFDWYIGAAIYVDDSERTLQQDILERLQNIRFSRNGEIFGFRSDGTVICHQQERFIGRSIRDFISNDVKYGQEMMEIGVSESGEGLIHYEKDPFQGSAKSSKKLAFIKRFDSWGWVLVASMAMDEMEEAIEKERKTYLRITFKNITLFIALFIIAVSLMLFFAYIYSLRIKQGISLFTNFFRKAADEKIRIEDDQFSFSEFTDLGYLANQMVDDRIQKEVLLRRDELRLDTLLQLGMMEDRCFQDKYDFILDRIIAITRSVGGYLALVNEQQTHINLYCLQEKYPRRENENQLNSGISRPVDKSGLPGEAVMQGRAVLNNKYDSDLRIFPYGERVRNHVDVPIFNSGKIVLVAGVYNNQNSYDNSDIRQMIMLLEGLWLHVLKVCAEEEMAKLERQIIAVSEEERSTIGRDLHDDLGSHLSGVELLCKVLQKKLVDQVPERAEELDAIRNLIREAIEITRRLAQGLYPVHVVEHGLVSSVEELKVEVENLFAVTCSLKLDVKKEQFDGSTAIHLYYIIREAVFNAARHGRPNTIDIIMNHEERILSLEIIDDGSGFEEGSIQMGIGLHTMKYRAKAIGAWLEVQSVLGKGTRIVFEGEVIV